MRLASTPRRARQSSKSIRSTSDPPKSSQCPRLHRGPWLTALHDSLLLGNPAKADKLLGWKRTVDFDSLVKEMVKADLEAVLNLVEDQN